MSKNFMPLIFVVVLVPALLLLFFKNYSTSTRLWTVEELARFNGTNGNEPILLGILGSVFDVTRGRAHYGPGGGYQHFIGRDASRAFVSGNFTGDGLTDSLRGLSSSEVRSIVDWRDFYYKKYKYVGKLIGTYYDTNGSPTKVLKGVESKAARGSQLLEKQKVEDAKLLSCNSRWSQEEGGEVWCETGYPRLVQKPLEMALTGKTSQRCACLTEEELQKPGLKMYSGCDFLAQRCKV